MPCPKCNGKLIYEERSWGNGGEVPQHWRCLNCGKQIFPGVAGTTPAEPLEKESEMEDKKTWKTCKKCRKELPATDEFFDRRGGGKYLEGRCKDCRSKAGKRKYRRKTQPANSSQLGAAYIVPEEIVISLQSMVKKAVMAKLAPIKAAIQEVEESL